MPDTYTAIHDVPVVVCAPEGKKLESETDAVDLIGESYHHAPEWIAIPVERLAAEFFQLKTRVAAEILQKFVNYGLRVAVLGDVTRHLAASEAFADMVRESNRGRHVWFLRDLDELGNRLRPSH